MTEWILFVMMCTRGCAPQYAVVYPSKAACEQAAKPTVNNWTSSTSVYCVPRVLLEDKR